MGLGDKGRVDLSEVIRNRLYFAPLHWTEDSVVLSALPRPGTAICIDNELIYEPFFADFGPLNLGCTYRFCWKLHGLMKEAEELGRCVLFYCCAEPKRKANAAVLLGAYLVLFARVDPEVAYGPLSMFEPYIPFRDPTCGISTYHLTVIDCIRGSCLSMTLRPINAIISSASVTLDVKLFPFRHVHLNQNEAIAKAQRVGWIDFNNFNLEEYEYFEQVENGDLNWVVPNKLLAFSGPSSRRLEIYGYRTLIPEDYIEYFHRVGVNAVIRLNKRTYDRRRFADHGISHYDLYFPDGSCPTDRVLKRFLEIVEETSGAIAVHCKAGLGRTGVLLGCYIMKHYRFSCNEVLGYLRIVRPGSVIGPQQHFLRDMQQRLWRSGDIMRQQLAQDNFANILPGSGVDCQPTRNDKSSALSPTLTSGSATVWNSGKFRLTNTGGRLYSANMAAKRDSGRDQISPQQNGETKAVQKAANRSMTENHAAFTPHRPKKITAANSPLSCMLNQIKEGKVPHHHEVPMCGTVNCTNISARLTSPTDGKHAEEGSRPHKTRVPTPARSSNMKKSGLKDSSKGTGLDSSMANLSLTAEKEPSCSPQLSKATRTSAYHGRSVSTPKHLNSTFGLNNDGVGILRNVGGANPNVPTRGGNVFVQRIVNSAGQPRKVVLPVFDQGPRSGPLQPDKNKREGSPSRRFSSPTRVSVSQGN